MEHLIEEQRIVQSLHLQLLPYSLLLWSLPSLLWQHEQAQQFPGILGWQIDGSNHRLHRITLCSTPMPPDQSLQPAASAITCSNGQFSQRNCYIPF